jgi:hypothetical protein
MFEIALNPKPDALLYPHSYSMYTATKQTNAISWSRGNRKRVGIIWDWCSGLCVCPRDPNSRSYLSEVPRTNSSTVPPLLHTYTLSPSNRPIQRHSFCCFRFLYFSTLRPPIPIIPIHSRFPGTTCCAFTICYSIFIPCPVSQRHASYAVGS